jgi:frataxin
MYGYLTGFTSPMPLDDTVFAHLSNLTLNRLADATEAEDEEGVLEVELLNGILSITLPSGQQFLVNRHGPSKQIWLSSPLSGGLHFDYDEEDQAWVLKDGRRLDTLLKAEVQTLLGEDAD